MSTSFWALNLDRTIRDILLETSDNEDPVIHRYYGGKGIGTVVKELTNYALHPDTVLISENGEVTTVGKVREWEGRGA